MDKWEYQNKPCYLENRAVSELCKWMTACTCFDFQLPGKCWANRQIARCTETENGCSNNFMHNTFWAISPSLASSQSQKEDSLAIFLEENYSRYLASFTLNLLYFSDLVKNQQNIILIQQDAWRQIIEVYVPNSKPT